MTCHGLKNFCQAKIIYYFEKLYYKLNFRSKCLETLLIFSNIDIGVMQSLTMSLKIEINLINITWLRRVK